MTSALPAEPAIAAGREPQVLQRVHEPGIDLAVWQRRLPRRLARWLEGLPPAALPSARLDVSAADAATALHGVCDAAGTPRGALRDALVGDIHGLVGRFSRLTGSARVHMRIEAIQDDACRRWHRDCVPLRLLTTYRGPGTEWVAGQWSAPALARPDDDAFPLERMPVHAVALFKGCGFIDQPHERGIVHRSPRVAGTGITRLVLCLNLPHAWRAGN